MKVYNKSWHNALAAMKYMHNRHHYNFPSKKTNDFLSAIGCNINDNDFMGWLGYEYDKWYNNFMTIVIKMPNDEIFYIPIGKDIELGKVGKIGETINEYFYHNVLAYEKELSDYSADEIRKSIIIGID